MIKKIGIRITESQFADINEIANAYSTTVSNVLRLAIVRLIRDYGNKEEDIG